MKNVGLFVNLINEKSILSLKVVRMEIFTCGNYLVYISVELCAVSFVIINQPRKINLYLLFLLFGHIDFLKIILTIFCKFLINV